MADKKTCFVIMRFESPYEERCERIYEPAIVKAGLEPRLARGPGVVKITDAIAEGINNSHLCLIDISENNPNVWSELGIALNCHGRITMVCDVEKRALDALPTDIRDRQVIPYRGEIVDSYRHARDGFRLAIEQDLRAKAVVPIVGHHSSAHVPDTDMPKLTDLNIKVLGAIVRICSDGETAAFLRTIVRELRRVGVSPLPERQDLQETIGDLTDYGLIEKAGSNMYDRKLIAHKPTLKGKKYHRTVKGRPVSR